MRILSESRKWMKDAYLQGRVDVKSAGAFRMGIRNSGADWSARMGVGSLQQPRDSTKGSTPLTINIQNPVPDMPDHPDVSRFEFLISLLSR